MTLFNRWLPAFLLCLACARGRPPVPILNYHSVAPGGDEFTVAPEEFEHQLDFLVSAGLRTVSLDDLVQHRDVSRGIVLTFDDGTEDALTRVLPALRKRGMRATFFVITGFVGKPGYLSWDGVRALAAAGMEIGSHSVDHAHLADESDQRVREELTASKRELESQLHAPLSSFDPGDDLVSAAPQQDDQPCRDTQAEEKTADLNPLGKVEEEAQHGSHAAR